MGDNSNNGGGGKVDNFKRLENLLQYNPSKRPTATQTLLAKVQKEIQEGRDKKAEELAKKTLEDAIALHEQGAKAKAQFEQQWAKFNKELGKLMNVLEAMNRGQEAPAEEPEGEQAAG